MLIELIITYCLDVALTDCHMKIFGPYESYQQCYTREMHYTADNVSEYGMWQHEHRKYKIQNRECKAQYLNVCFNSKWIVGCEMYYDAQKGDDKPVKGHNIRPQG